MTILVTLLFSLVWGALVWLVQALVARGMRADLHTPPTCLALIATIALPSLVAGLPLPDLGGEAEGTVMMMAQVNQGLGQLTAPINPWAGGSNGIAVSWVGPVIVALYLAGLAFHLFKTARACLELSRCVKTASRLDGISSRWPLLLTQQNVAPFAFGGRRAVIVIPAVFAAVLRQDNLALIVAHEEEHLRHGDPRMALILSLVSGLFWFNPALRHLVSCWHQSCELRADAAALKGKTAIERKAYARTLLDALRLASGVHPIGLSVSFLTGKTGSLHMRLCRILKDGPVTKAGGSGSLALRAGIAGLALLGSVAAMSIAIAEPNNHGPLLVKGGRMTMPFGIKRADGTIHKGVDIRAEKGAPIAAPGDGVVIEATDLFRGEWRYGKTVALQLDDDLIVWFAHLDTYAVKAGDRIRKGQVFATIGNSGLSTRAHLHIEAFRDRGRQRIDPMDVLSGL